MHGRREVRRRGLGIAGASVALLAGVVWCRADDPARQTTTPSVTSVVVGATVSNPAERGPGAPTTTIDASAGWTYVSTREPSSRGGSWCVQLTNAGRSASTCLSVPGHQRWTVGGAQFALTRGAELRFSDGEIVRPDANGVAIAPVRGRTLDDERDAFCALPDIGSAIAAADATPSTAWMVVRCAPDKAAVVAFNLPDERTAFLERVGTTWRVVHVTAATDACGTVPAVADICSSVAL